jgi:2-polyprenyl-3-methyl-5-hydroxy-6-metoxy-1,4-benzoquinol methylase
MAIYRTKTEVDFKTYGSFREANVTIPNEWDINNGQERINDSSWLDRYKYEANIINDVCKENNYSKILELGSGPGVLGQFVLELNPNIEYSFVDKPAAKQVFESKNYKGNFYVKDLMNGFDITNLDNDYDLIIANDFLEHIANPSDVLYKCRSITKDNSCFFISVPNWRMGHDFIYRGLFDYDNFIYFCKTHGWEPENIAPSPLKCTYYPKESSEQTMPDELIQSWNWYFITKKLTNE